MKLSKRLEALAGMVPGGSAVLDVGCDHAYVPIALVARGISPCAVASDIRPGPLRAADAHIRAAGLEGSIVTALSDGVPADIDGLFLAAGYDGAAPRTLITAGMGGLMIRDILRGMGKERGYFRHLLLSPQRDAHEARRAAAAAGYEITKEKMIEEEGKYYPLILASFLDGSPKALSEEEAEFGPLLLACGDSVFWDYLEKKRLACADILSALPASAKGRRAEVLERLRRIEALVRRHG